MPTLAEAARLSPEERYRRSVARLLRQRDALTDGQVREMLRTLGRARRRLLDDLARAPADAGTWRAFHLSTLQAAIDRAALDLARDFRRLAGAAVERAWEQGAEFAPRTLRAVGIDLDLFTAISRGQLLMAQELAGDLISRVSDDFRTQARGLVVRAVLGERSAWQTMRDLSALLRTEPLRTDPRLGPVAYQAERIQRTEMLGAFALANESRHRQIAEEVPGLRKYWLATLDGRTRPEHVAVWRRYHPGGSEGPIPVGTDYRVGGQPARGPHDARLSAAMRIHCRCVSLLYRAEWFG